MPSPLTLWPPSEKFQVTDSPTLTLTSAGEKALFATDTVAGAAAACEASAPESANAMSEARAVRPMNGVVMELSPPPATGWGQPARVLCESIYWWHRHTSSRLES